MENGKADVQIRVLNNTYLFNIVLGGYEDLLANKTYYLVEHPDGVNGAHSFYEPLQEMSEVEWLSCHYEMLKYFHNSDNMFGIYQVVKKSKDEVLSCNPWNQKYLLQKFENGWCTHAEVVNPKSCLKH